VFLINLLYSDPGKKNISHPKRTKKNGLLGLKRHQVMKKQQNDRRRTDGVCT
jgi:hypothetical protein